jgi:hypothetical protein
MQILQEMISMSNPFFLYTEDVSISKFYDSKEEAEAAFELLRKDYEDKGYDVQPISEARWAPTFEERDGGWTMYFSASKEVINPNHKPEEHPLEHYHVALP